MSFLILSVIQLEVIDKPGDVKTLLYNVIFYLVFSVFALLYLPLFILLVFMDRLFLTRRRAAHRLRLRIQFFGRAVLTLLRPIAPVVCEGDGWKEALEGGCVYICNHRSFSDPFLIASLPRVEVVQIVNKWPFHIPVLGLVARLASYVDVRRMTLEQFYEKGSSLLSEGVKLVSFPEGTRSVGRKTGGFHGAIFRLVQMTGVPLFPIAISGNECTPKKGSLILHFSVIRMRMLAPITGAESRNMTAFRLKEEVRERIRLALAEMEGSANE